MSHFPFVSNGVLRSNLDIAFEHIKELIVVSESKNYQGRNIQISSFRKTVIIHVAAIIEALLLWKLKEVCKKNKIELADEWKYFDIRAIYRISGSEEAIAGLRKKEERSMDKLDFVRIADLCVTYKIIRPIKLKTRIDKVRQLRNRMHLGGLSEIEREYTKADLEFCFGVVDEIKSIVSK